MSNETRQLDSQAVAHVGISGRDTHLSLLIYDRDGAQMVLLSPAQPTIVGRGAPAGVVIREESLSRQHARFEIVGGETWIEDLQSTNGTWVNGKRAERQRVKPGDDIRLGAVTATLHILTPTERRLYGLDSHDQFVAHLEYEIDRARSFSRPAALLQIRTAQTGDGQMSRWCPRVRELLRPADRIALYSPTAVEVLLPELDQQQAAELAQRVVEERRPEEPNLLCGIAVFPASAVSAEALLAAAQRAARRANARTPCVTAPERAGGRPVVERSGPVVRSATTRALYEQVDQIASSAAPVLIYGETGVGKEVVARAIHQRGRRAPKPFVPLNCAAIPPSLAESKLFGHVRGAFTDARSDAQGVFEAAHGGTVLLDEIGELAPELQAKLLRVLESKTVTRVGDTREIPIDVRVIAATHRDIEAMCDEGTAGTFRWDLYYRLNTLTLTIPPLRDRRDEIAPLAEHFLAQANHDNERDVQGIDANALELLQRHDWPGNVRQLRNVIERAVLIAGGDRITADDLDRRVRGGDRTRAPGDAAPTPAFEDDDSLPFKERVQRFERHLIVSALEHTSYKQTHAAEWLRIPLRTLVFKIRAYEVKRPEDA